MAPTEPPDPFELFRSDVESYGGDLEAVIRAQQTGRLPSPDMLHGELSMLDVARRYNQPLAHVRIAFAQAAIGRRCGCRQCAGEVWRTTGAAAEHAFGGGATAKARAATQPVGVQRTAARRQALLAKMRGRTLVG